MEKDNVPSVVIGVKTVEQLDDCLGSSNFKLAESDVSRLDEASEPYLPYPYEQIARMNKCRFT